MANKENNTQEIDESLSLLDKARDIPVYKAAEAVGMIDKIQETYNMSQEGARQFNQLLGDTVSSLYNLVGVPLNVLGKEFGYNPGFSGERVMKDVFGWSGYQPRGDVDAPLTISAEQVPFKDQPLGALVKTYLDRNAAVSDSSNLAPTDTAVQDTTKSLDISDERRAFLEEFWTFPKERQDSIMAKLGDQTKAELQSVYPAKDDNPEGTYDYIAKAK